MRVSACIVVAYKKLFFFSQPHCSSVHTMMPSTAPFSVFSGQSVPDKRAHGQSTAAEYMYCISVDSKVALSLPSRPQSVMKT